MNAGNIPPLDRLREMVLAIASSARESDLSGFQAELARLEVWAREHILNPPHLPTTQEPSEEVLRLRELLRASKSGFESAVAAYKSLLDTFDIFRASIDIIQQVRHLTQVPQAMDMIRGLRGMHILRLILDRDLFGAYAPPDIALTPQTVLRENLAQFTPAPHYPRLFLGSIAVLQQSAFFLGNDAPPATGSCFIFALGHRYRPGALLGAVVGYDPDPKRYKPDMATDFLGHFCDILAGTLLNALDHAHLEELSVRDTLTGVNNRAYLERHAPRLLDFAARGNFSLHLLFIDLNGFKAVNDTLGHDAGDLILKHVAQTIQSMVRRYDIFARLGGDEFVVVLPGTDERMASAFRSRLRKALAALDVSAICDQHTRITVGAAIGMAQYSTGMSLDDLIREADQRMFAEKANTRASRTPGDSHD